MLQNIKMLTLLLFWTKRDISELNRLMRYYQLSQEQKVENQEYFRKSRLVE